MKKKKYLICVFIAVLAFSAIAYAANEPAITSLISTQGVDIRVSAEADTSLFAPGGKVRYAPVIENRGMDSYIRFRTDIADENLPNDAFYGLSEDWIRRGDYLYYTKPVKSGESLSTYAGFTVPSAWDKADSHDITITKICDAIQAKHFTPDFSAEEPWGSVAVKESSYDGSSYINEVAALEPLVLKFKRAGEQSLSSDDIMAFSVAPGDSLSNYIELTNLSENAMEIYLTTTADDSELLKAGTLSLTAGDKLLYTGDIRVESFVDAQKIVTLAPDESKKLNYEISVPAELDNAYAEMRGEFEWRFTTEEIITAAAPTTGDTQNLITVLIVLLGSLLLVIAMAVHQKRKEGKDDKEK